MDGIGEFSVQDRARNKARRLLGLPDLELGTVLFMGSTNRPDSLDPALVRAGRFDWVMPVDSPDRKGREDVIGYYVGSIKSAAVDVPGLASLTAWATPAQIMSAITKDYVRRALVEDRPEVTQRDVERALQEQVDGLQSPISDLDPEQKRQICVHEAGHTVAQYHLRKDERIAYVSAVRTSKALGYMLPTPVTDLYSISFLTLKRDIMIGLAGHMAVIQVMKQPWSGASGDIRSVHGTLIKMANNGAFGMPKLDGTPTAAVEEAVARLLKDCASELEDLLIKYQYQVEAVAAALEDQGEISGNEAVQIIEEARKA